MNDKSKVSLSGIGDPVVTPPFVSDQSYATFDLKETHHAKSIQKVFYALNPPIFQLMQDGRLKGTPYHNQEARRHLNWHFVAVRTASPLGHDYSTVFIEVETTNGLWTDLGRDGSVMSQNGYLLLFQQDGAQLGEARRITTAFSGTKQRCGVNGKVVFTPFTISNDIFAAMNQIYVMVLRELFYPCKK